MQKVTFVSVSPAVSKKALAVDNKLAQLGVQVGAVQFDNHAIKDAVEAAKVAWLAYSIGKEAVKHWPAIKDVLTDAGLTKHEIIILDLSKKIEKKFKKTKKRKKKDRT